MTGRGSSASTGETRTAADLLDDDGRIDPSAVASLTNGIADREDRVQASEASEIRRRLLNGETTTEIAEDIGRAASTVRPHAKGEVDYPRNETPEVPPLEYGPGGWRSTDE